MILNNIFFNRISICLHSGLVLYSCHNLQSLYLCCIIFVLRANDCPPVVKSLSEIQQEEAERLTQLSRMQKPQAVSKMALNIQLQSQIYNNFLHYIYMECLKYMFIHVPNTLSNYTPSNSCLNKILAISQMSIFTSIKIPPSLTIQFRVI